MANKPWKIVLLLIGIFLAGGVTGGFVTLRFGRELLSRRAKPDQWAPQQLKRLADRLELKPEQVELLRPIVRSSMEQISRVRSVSVQETRTIYERMEHDIAELLTPEQRTKFEQLNKEMRERARRLMPDGPNRGFGPGGPGVPGETDKRGGPVPLPSPTPPANQPPLPGDKPAGGR